MRLLLFTLFAFTSIFGNAQIIFERLPHDRVWLFGGRMIRMDFVEDSIAIFLQEREIRFDATNANICDASGNLQLYTNGVQIANVNHALMENGERINPGEYSDDRLMLGYYIPQGALILPEPDSDSMYHVFYVEDEVVMSAEGAYSVETMRLHQALVDMSANEGVGRVVEKDFPLIVDTLDFGKLTAVRHANGRDWWIMIPYRDADRLHRFLLSPQGIIDMGAAVISERMRGGLGQSVFSPKGNYYTNHSLHRFNEDYLAIYDFDRCSGILSNPRILPDTLFSLTGGVAISENGRFLYQSSYRKLFQVDLLADSLEQLLIAEYDGYHEDPERPNALWTTFAGLQLTPDSRIFMTTTTSARYLHVIQSPNRRGEASSFVQRDIELPAWNQRTIPNFPYYGLGPLDGSPCDTLGIDNPVPEAVFEYTIQDSSVQVEFFDASHFMPTYAERLLDTRIGWQWNFGDGSAGDTTRFPVHTFPAVGSYEVCLTVSNVTGADTYCEEIFVGTTAVTEVVKEQGILEVFPNPAQDYFTVSLPDNLNEAYLELYNSVAQRVRHERVFAGGNTIQIEELPSGVYTCHLWDNGIRLGSGKVIKAY